MNRRVFVQSLIVLIPFDVRTCFGQADTDDFNEVYNTKPVERLVRNSLSQITAYNESGFLARSDVARAIRDDERIIAALERRDFRFMSFPAVDQNQLHYYYRTLIKKYATIKLEVQPVPPRDYTVVINGETCPVRASYRVLAGNSTVNVTRPAKPPCQWSGQLADGAEKEVSCSL